MIAAIAAARKGHKVTLFERMKSWVKNSILPERKM